MSRFVRDIRRARRRGLLPKRFRGPDVQRVCPTWSESTYRVFLAKHRRGNPGGNTAYFIRHKDETYSLIEDEPTQPHCRSITGLTTRVRMARTACTQTASNSVPPSILCGTIPTSFRLPLAITTFALVCAITLAATPGFAAPADENDEAAPSDDCGEASNCGGIGGWRVILLAKDADDAGGESSSDSEPVAGAERVHMVFRPDLHFRWSGQVHPYGDQGRPYANRGGRSGRLSRR